MRSTDIAIVGAGPYGLSIAAHLREAGVDFRIFGSPMEFWLRHMPKGMHLKSEGFASSLSDPSGAFPLRTYCAERGIPYADIGNPVPLDVFSSYGQEFQKRFVPNLEQVKVTGVRRSGGQFQVTLENGEQLLARRVVVAVGQTYYAHLPEELSGLPKELLTHSSEHSALEKFAGREIAIVGAGASALDLAALLHEAGAKVQIVARVQKIRYHDALDPKEPSWIERLRNPVTGIGPGWKLWMCTNLPLVFRLMPADFRLEKVRQILGPAPCWFIREKVEGKVDFHLGVSVASIAEKGGRVSLELVDKAGSKKTIVADHVIAATGFKSSLKRLVFLEEKLAAEIQSLDNTPVLSPNFESTARNLYFVGVTAANTFGPLLRFAYGAEFAAPRISKHLRQTAPSASPKAIHATHESKTQVEESTETVTR
jgi:thioredoxin reductase